MILDRIRENIYDRHSFIDILCNDDILSICPEVKRIEFVKPVDPDKLCKPMIQEKDQEAQENEKDSNQYVLQCI